METTQSTVINLKRQLVPYEWLQFPQKIKQLFIDTFKIPKSGGAIVTGNVLQSDGYTVEDLGKVNLAALQEYLKTDDTHWDNLLQLTINKMENPDATPTTTEGTAPDVRPESPSPKRGRPKKETTA